MGLHVGRCMIREPQSQPRSQWGGVLGAHSEKFMEEEQFFFAVSVAPRAICNATTGWKGYPASGPGMRPKVAGWQGLGIAVSPEKGIPP